MKTVITGIFIALIAISCKKEPRTAIIRYEIIGHGTSSISIDYIDDDRTTKHEEVKIQSWEKSFTIEAGEPFKIKACELGASFVRVKLYINGNLYDEKHTFDCKNQSCGVEISGIVQDFY